MKTTNKKMMLWRRLQVHSHSAQQRLYSTLYSEWLPTKIHSWQSLNIISPHEIELTLNLCIHQNLDWNCNWCEFVRIRRAASTIQVPQLHPHSPIITAPYNDNQKRSSNLRDRYSDELTVVFRFVAENQNLATIWTCNTKCAWFCERKRRATL